MALPIRKQFKRPLSGLIIVLTLALFWYFISHRNVLHQLRSISPSAIVMICLLYMGMTVVLACINQLSLQLLGKRLPAKENFLLSAYSSIVNFFGPLQSGPGARAVYLKRRLKVSLKQYAAVSLGYYFCFALFSAWLFVAGWLAWWVSGILAVLVISVIWQLRQRFAGRYSFISVSPWQLWQMCGLVALQLLIVCLIYQTELRSIGATLGWRQLIAYTGAANFSLFVSLTPGALGFREGFLLLTRSVTHLDANTIVAANLIDRAIYIVFLAGLFFVVLALHGQELFKTKVSATTPSEAD